MTYLPVMPVFCSEDLLSSNVTPVPVQRQCKLGVSIRLVGWKTKKRKTETNKIHSTQSHKVQLRNECFFDI
jgi:hypothetical protein